MPFYESLRTALTKSAVGVHQAGAPLPLLFKKASESRHSEKASETRAHAIPNSYQDFLYSFNGLSLFHESIHFASLEEMHTNKEPFQSNYPRIERAFVESSTSLPEDFGRTMYFFDTKKIFPCCLANSMRIGEMPQGSLWMDESGLIRLVDEERADPLVMGSTLEKFLDVVLETEGMLIDASGEFLDVFDENGEPTQSIRKKQIKVGRKKDPSAAYYLWQEAEFLIESHKPENAIFLLTEATRNDPLAGPCWELLGSLYKEKQDFVNAELCFAEAANSGCFPSLKANRAVQAAEVSKFSKEVHIAAAWHWDESYASSLILSIQNCFPDQLEEANKQCDQLELLLKYAPAIINIADWQNSFTNLKRQLRGKSLLKII